MSALKDLTGQRFGRLTVIERAENKGEEACWKCRCDCNNEVFVRGSSLRKGTTKSCGCLVEKNRIKHGMRHTPIYNTWCHIKARCLNSSNNDYKYYGGRGITMYPEWINNFQAFYDYVSKLEHYGEKGYTLDRIDNNGNYEPNNLRWADKKTQRRNQSRIHFVEYEGVLMSLTEASEKSGIPRDTLKSRSKRGDTGDRLFRPVKQSTCHKS